MTLESLIIRTLAGLCLHSVLVGEVRLTNRFCRKTGGQLAKWWFLELQQSPKQMILFYTNINPTTLTQASHFSPSKTIKNLTSIVAHHAIDSTPSICEHGCMSFTIWSDRLATWAAGLLATLGAYRCPCLHSILFQQCSYMNLSTVSHIFA